MAGGAREEEEAAEIRHFSGVESGGGIWGFKVLSIFRGLEGLCETEMGKLR